MSWDSFVNDVPGPDRPAVQCSAESGSRRLNLIRSPCALRYELEPFVGCRLVDCTAQTRPAISRTSQSVNSTVPTPPSEPRRSSTTARARMSSTRLTRTFTIRPLVWVPVNDTGRRGPTGVGTTNVHPWIISEQGQRLGRGSAAPALACAGRPPRRASSCPMPDGRPLAPRVHTRTPGRIGAGPDPDGWRPDHPADSRSQEERCSRQTQKRLGPERFAELVASHRAGGKATRLALKVLPSAGREPRRHRIDHRRTWQCRTRRRRWVPSPWWRWAAPGRGRSGRGMGPFEPVEGQGCGCRSAPSMKAWNWSRVSVPVAWVAVER
jgi:hypothetical protein